MRREHAGAAAGRFLGAARVRRAVRAEEEARVARSRGLDQRLAVALALQERQAVQVRPQAAREHRAAVEEQVLRRDRRGDAFGRRRARTRRRRGSSRARARCAAAGGARASGASSRSMKSLSRSYGSTSPPVDSPCSCSTTSRSSMRASDAFAAARAKGRPRRSASSRRPGSSFTPATKPLAGGAVDLGGRGRVGQVERHQRLEGSPAGSAARMRSR